VGSTASAHYPTTATTPAASGQCNGDNNNHQDKNKRANTAATTLFLFRPGLIFTFCIGDEGISGTVDTRKIIPLPEGWLDFVFDNPVGNGIGHSALHAIPCLDSHRPIAQGNQQ